MSTNCVWGGCDTEEMSWCDSDRWRMFVKEVCTVYEIVRAASIQ